MSHSVMLVNVLNKAMFDDCHIKGSLNIELQNLKNYAEHTWHKDSTKVILYCANYYCDASLKAAKILIDDLGFNKDNVWIYKGGSAQARHDGVPVLGACSSDYLQELPQIEHKEHYKDGIKIMGTEQLKDVLNHAMNI